MLIETRRCEGRKKNGEPCQQSPLREGRLCFWHDPDHVEDAARARKMGGQRRRREGAVTGAYDLEGLQSVEQLRRLLEIAAIDALSLENSVGRVRALTAIVQTGARLLETGELEERVAMLEAVTGARQR